MKLSLKQYMASVTDSIGKAFYSVLRKRKDVFFRARLKLTFYYVLFMVIIIGLFSTYLITEVDRSMQAILRRQIGRTEVFRKEFPTDSKFEISFDRINQMHEREYAEASKAIKTLIISVDTFLLLLVIALSWVLAGRTLRPVRKALEEQKRFVADVSHDLRTPLAIMKTETEVALTGTLNGDCEKEEYRNTLKSNLEEIDKMSSLVSDLLLLARSDNSFSDYNQFENKNNEVINVKDLVQALCDKNRKLSELKSQRFTFEADNQKTYKVLGHYNSIERALQNIIQNAISYTQESGHISVSIQQTGYKIKILVKDTGVGIAKADLPKVFDRFYKASHARSQGTGLGLPIAKQIIEQYGGSVSLTSEVSKGTEVAVVLPSLK